jgi:hypothetical protein
MPPSLNMFSIPVPHLAGNVKVTHVLGLYSWSSLGSCDATACRFVIKSKSRINEIADFIQYSPGAWSDRCTSRFGRRRPYLVAGTLLSTAALLLLGFTRHVASIFGLAEAPVCALLLA